MIPMWKARELDAALMADGVARRRGVDARGARGGALVDREAAHDLAAQELAEVRGSQALPAGGVEAYL